ncbi:TlyA family rRNA (cytidine-2'-O)-methyltransferase [Brooklawnia cerclae]|uniref:23S rRNA (Cytidine1920-2'-O)/16S rRNA (Cytidine1409-2'-O)-methyltransferase n=1 Tax=Brooklawnia cerclae TaxID=349934 RepID=A0ABX0SCR6_9ACTN|nr:TlyA family RNA methyltransferase [Brooklawnia cerclae]NIH56124.1 23S rRNA (cytidine1920-2'-O)/16S rRNA (cytidine1409-2'-O)-methyltransferase [Brooklawnia cerclae]
MRLDLALVQRGLARSRSQAHELIRSGRVRVNGSGVRRPAHDVDAGDTVEADADRWVSRAAHKLIGALDASGTAVPARVLDAGASTGGFTQVLLDRGARRVYAVDVGHDQLAPVIRQDPRVRVREGLNLRDLGMHDLDDEPVDLAVGDVSFISLVMLLEPIFAVVAPGGQALLMVKPQFEVGRERLGAGGVVRSAADRAEAIDRVVARAGELGWTDTWRGDSRLPGPAGNLEHFVRFERESSSRTSGPTPFRGEGG